VLEQAWHEGHARARLAIKTFVHRIARHIAGHSRPKTASRSLTSRRISTEFSPIPPVKIMPSRRCSAMDAARNQQPNSDGERLISADGSRVRCAVIPTNEAPSFRQSRR
jgi:propionate kinase